MDVGAVGAAIGGAGGCAGMASAPASTPSTATSEITGTQVGALGNAALGPASASSIANQGSLAGISPDVQNLMQALKDFSTADILLAMMLMKAADSQNHHKCQGADGALGFLAGMALASKFSHLAANMDFSQSVGQVGGAGAGVGQQVNVQA